MGKKRVIQKTEKELLAEREKVDQKVQKDFALKSSHLFREGLVYISSTYNNTIITLANRKGDVICWRSAGNIGFKGTKKGTSFAASKVAQAIASVCERLRINEITVFVKGIGSGRDSALKTLATQGLNIVAVKDITPIPHNGCRPKKPRRV